MKKAFKKKWFLLTDESTWFDLSDIPMREVKVFDEKADGFDLRITRVFQNESYEWVQQVRFDGLQHPVYNCMKIDAVAAKFFSDSKYTSTFFLKSEIVGTASSEIIYDEKGREILIVEKEHLQNSEKSPIGVLKYISSKL